MLIWWAGIDGGKGGNLRAGKVKWPSSGKAAQWTSDLHWSIQGLSKVLTPPGHTKSLQILVHTSHQTSVHLSPSSWSFLFSKPHMFFNGLFTLASCLANILPTPFSLPAFPKACFFTRQEWMAPCHPAMLVSYGCNCTTQISVWIAKCYSASTVNSGCLGQACSQKRSLLS